MAPPVFIEPDLDFIAQINSDSGLNLKKCYQCATCSVVCTLSDDDQPFPRKEMIYASWGLKDRLIANPDIWLCYNCGDCSTLCPRDARPGDVLNTLRKMSIGEYSKPAVLHRLLNDIRKLPLLFIIPALIILAMGFATGFMNLSPGGDRIVFAHFWPVPLIEMIFIPLSLGVTLVFFLGITGIFILRGLLVIPELLVIMGVVQSSILVAPRFVVFSIGALVIGFFFIAGTIGGWNSFLSKN